MSLTSSQKQSIAIEVIKVLVTRFSSFPEADSTIRNAPFHDAFLVAFSDKLQEINIDSHVLISLSSWFHGLNTNLGQSFFENTANVICGGEKKEWTSKKNGTLQISQSEKDVINRIVTELSNSKRYPNALEEWKIIEACEDTVLVNALDFSADVFYEDNDSVTAIELKSVKPNSGEMRGEKQKMLEGKAALHRIFPGKQVNFFIGFPFDPNLDLESRGNGCHYDKTQFMSEIVNGSKFFDPKEILLATELWDKLSSEPLTMESILNIINVIATTDFEDKLHTLLKYRITDHKLPLGLLRQWQLFSELDFISKLDILKGLAEDDRKLNRYMSQSCITPSGKLNYTRYNYISSLMTGYLSPS